MKFKVDIEEFIADMEAMDRVRHTQGDVLSTIEEEAWPKDDDAEDFECRSIEIPFPSDCATIYGVRSLSVPMREVLTWAAAAHPEDGARLLAIRDDFYSGNHECDYDYELNFLAREKDLEHVAELIIKREAGAEKRLMDQHELAILMADDSVAIEKRFRSVAEEFAQVCLARQRASPMYRGLEKAWVEFVRAKPSMDADQRNSWRAELDDLSRAIRETVEGIEDAWEPIHLNVIEAEVAELNRDTSSGSDAA